MPSLFTGSILKKKKAHYQICRKLEFNTDDSVIVEADGENIGVPPVVYTILPQALKVIV
jgi:diacylglycerol kinase family enzyme